MLRIQFSILVFSSFFLNFASTKEIPTVAIAEEVGKGIGKIAFNLESLINECEPENLLEWYEFMEKYLECKESARYKETYEEYLEMPQLSQVEKHCTAWPNLHRCYTDLANTLNVCYEKMNGMKKKGTDALKFSDTFSRFVCHHKHQYLANAVSNAETILPTDRRPMKCYMNKKRMISECAAKKFKQENSPNLCRNVAIVRECFEMSYDDCEDVGTKEFLTTMLKQISLDLHCT